MKKILPVLVVLAVAAGGAYMYFFKQNVPDTLNTEFVKIPTGSTVSDLVKQLNTEGFVTDETNFNQWASWLKFKNARSGRFKIKAGWSSYDLIKHLQRGEQAPVKVVLNNERTPAQVAGKISKVLESDSLTFINTFLDEAYLDSLGYKKETLMCLMLPNTYDLFWNTTPKKFIERMLKEHKRFWTEERTAKAKALKMNPDEAVTMASIVEGESNQVDERPRVAGAYLNRLMQNIKLQADPTVQFALMESEKTPSFRRLLNRDYLFQHPYNTYIHDGLPPGPICMPTMATIDAVLNPEKHDYIYFCAKPDLSGYHNYAVTFEQHLQNVKIYTTWLAQQRNR